MSQIPVLMEIGMERSGEKASRLTKQRSWPYSLIYVATNNLIEGGSLIEVRQRGRKIYTAIKAGGKQSIRQLARATALSKSSVQRYLQAWSKRAIHPEAPFWETEAGQKWLSRLICAVLYEFGIQGGGGGEKLSRFFKRIHLEKHIGVSPTTLRRQLRQMEELLGEYQRFHEAHQRAGGKTREAVVGGDETFFNDLMILVLMDLPSGYLLMEEMASDRGYETWRAKAQGRLESLGLSVRHFVSDRAKALIKLALSGFECAAGADLFHGQYTISKWLGSALARRSAPLIKHLHKAKECLAKMGQQRSVDPKRIEEKEKEIAHYEDQLQSVRSVQEQYHTALRGISEAVHPFRLEDSAAQTAERVEDRLHEQAEQFKELAEQQSIGDSRGALNTFKTQIKEIAHIVGAWWLWAIESIAEDELEPGMQDWVLYSLLPVLYWHQQMEKAQNRALRRAYRKAWERALAAWQAHPLTIRLAQDQIQHWEAWAAWIVGQFQRASSAVEGRNGWLSQMYHNARGLTPQRLVALTVIHNFELRRSDGTTAAERLFGTPFPDLFEWVLGRMGELPLPRRARERVKPNPLNLQTVPA